MVFKQSNPKAKFRLGVPARKRNLQYSQTKGKQSKRLLLPNPSLPAFVVVTKTIKQMTDHVQPKMSIVKTAAKEDILKEYANHRLLDK